VCTQVLHKVPSSMLNLNDAIARAYNDIVQAKVTLTEKLARFEFNWKVVHKIIEELPTSRKQPNIDFELRYFSQRVRGHAFMEFRNFEKSFKYYRKAKKLCEKYRRYKEKMLMYQQLAYILRLMKEHDGAVKQSRKMLQLSWQEGDIAMEMQAYDCLSVEYYYLGELGKSRYYHDRIIRGKVENDHSIIKKVTCNLLRSRCEQRHNDAGFKYSESQKLKSEIQRLPSPSNLSKGAQVSKAISLLPHYTEA
jgi:tetratricopeptide (TPR) repeat protein